MNYYYRNTFAHLLFHLYEGSWKNGLRDHARFLVGAQILLHVFRMSCVRGHDIKTAIIQAKQAHTYFFEYLQQMTESGFSIDDAKMSTFIYDQVLLVAQPSIALEEPDTEDLDALPHIFALLPAVTDTTVSVEQLQGMWLVGEQHKEQERLVHTNHAESELSSSIISNDQVA